MVVADFCLKFLPLYENHSSIHLSFLVLSFYSWSDIDSRSFEHIESFVNIFKMVNITHVLSLSTICELSYTHVLNALFAEFFATL